MVSLKFPLYVGTEENENLYVCAQKGERRERNSDNYLLSHLCKFMTYEE